MIMKKLSYLLLAGALLTVTPGCNKYFEDINTNPNDLTEVTPNLLLPAVEAHIAYGFGGDISRLTSIIMQQATGFDRQYLTYQTYNITETETDNFWRFNLYGGPMEDIYQIIEGSKAKGDNHYQGVGNVLMAYCLLSATDLFGDIPYTEAFLGNDNMTPAYDTQEEIYNTVFALLTEAQTLFANPDAGPLPPGAEDFLYGGDVTMWAKMARVLEARAHLHLGKRDNSHYAMALASLGTEGVDSYGSNADDATYNFGTGETESGPWFQFNDQRGDIDFSGWMLDTMLVLTDPRLDAYVDTSGGGAAMGPFYGNPDAPYIYTSYVEQKFIEAEAAFQSGDLARAATAHNAAVMASLDRHGVAGVNTAFETAEANETAGTITLAKIMVHKYLASFTEVEVFTDWRRTGFPAIQPVVDNVTGDIIPRRLPNPQSERLYNPNAPAAPAITTRLWWDLP